MRQTLYLKLRKILYIVLLLSCLPACFMLYPLNAFSGSADNMNTSKPMDIKEGWQYRRGDSPMDTRGFPVWALEDTENRNWNSMDCLDIPPEYDGIQNIWLRIELPPLYIKNPYMYVKTANQAFEVYHSGKLIYKYPDTDAPVNRELLGDSIHIFPVESYSQNKYIFFRIYSFDMGRTGIISDLKLGSTMALQSYIFKKDMDKIILGPLFIFIGLIMMVVFLHNFNKDKSNLSIGLFSLCIGIWTIAQTDLKLFLFNNPPVWYYIDILTLYLIPSGMCMYVVQVFKSTDTPLMRYSRLFFIINAIVVFILDMANIIPMYLTMNLFFVALLLTMPILIRTVARISIKGDTNAVIFTAGLLILCLTSTYDILGKHYNLLPWKSHFTPYGMLIFVFCLLAIVVKRFLEVHRQLQAYSNEIETKNEALNHMFLEIKSSKEKIARWSEGLEQAVMEKTASIRDLLDNAGQGFLSFGISLLIRNNYSNECIKIFGDTIEGKNFAELVFPNDDTQKEFFRDITRKILLEDDNSKRVILLSLIPDEVILLDRDIHIDYKIINDGTEESGRAFMAILTDITEKRFLEKQMEQEKSTLKMVVNAVVNYNDLIECIKDYKAFCTNKMHSLLSSKLPPQKILFSVFRDVHTFKGSFNQLDMINVAAHLNELENVISILCKNINNKSLEEFKTFISGINMDQWLEEDLSILNDILGEQFFNQENTVRIDKARLLELENTAKSLLSPHESYMLLPHLKALRYKPFNELLKSYPQYVADLSGRMEKLLNPLIIEGGDFLVDADIFYSFTRSLSHIFRNIVDHGIESIEERISNGKEESGNVKCIITASSSEISLIISDDGRGIDLDSVRNKALETGFIDKESGSLLSEDEILNFIFKEGFSTKEFTGGVSGRGVGLYSVKSEVDNLSGKIEVKTTKGEGTEFYFRLPYGTPDKFRNVSVSSYIEPVVDTAKKLFNEQTGLVLNDTIQNGIEEVENILLRDVTVFINIKGVLEGTFIMSSDETLIKSIIQSFIAHDAIMYNISEDESSFIHDEILSEFFNTVLGNSIDMISQAEDPITIDTPVTLCSKKGTMLKYPGSGIWSHSLECASGGLIISFMTSKNLHSP